MATADPKVKCETFNPGISPIDLPANLLIRGLASVPFRNIKEHHINGDPISGTLGAGRNTNYDCGLRWQPWKAHSHDNFLKMLDK